MVRRHPRSLRWPSRRLRLPVLILFGIFVVFDIALFGWLLFRSLSQREIEEILLEARAEAEPLAQYLSQQAEELGQDDLFVVLSVVSASRQLGEELEGHELMRNLEIKDPEGAVVYQEPLREVPRVEGGSSTEPELKLPRLDDEGYEAEVPIGDLGWLVISLSPEKMQERVALLRRDLARQVWLIGGFTVALLGVAFATILLLFRRAELSERQSVEAERLAYVGTLASGLAHEIRSPLNSLNLNMQMLEEEATDCSDLRDGKRLLSITRAEIGRLENLVTDFLTYARPRPLELTEMPVAELFERVLELLAGEIQAHGAEVRIRGETDGAVVRVDPHQMQQLLLNLTQNALAATTETGRRPLIELRARRLTAQVAIEITDNGCGIPEEEQARIFDVFFSKRRGGTGLGLAIVERIASSHGAEIELESTPGEGTTIRLLMSAVHREAINGRSASVGPPAAGGRQPAKASNSSSVMNSSGSSAPQAVQRASVTRPSDHSKV